MDQWNNSIQLQHFETPPGLQVGQNHYRELFEDLV